MHYFRVTLTSVLVATAGFGLASFGCSGDSSHSPLPLPSAAGEPGPGAFAGDFDTSGGFFTKMSGLQTASGAHGDVHIWYSANVQSLVETAQFTAPVGTTAVKKFDMNADGSVDGIAVMVKKEAGFDPGNGDWWYEMRDTTGQLKTDPPAGNIAMCINCHKGWAGTDYLAGTTMQ